MKQTAKVTAAGNGYATVRVSRTSACAGCAGSATCFACENIAEARAKNEAGAVPGDLVTVESSSARIVGYAAAVFVMPPAAGIFCFYLADSFFPENGVLVHALPVLLFAFLFAASCLFINRLIRKHPDITVTEVLRSAENDNGGEV